MEQTGKELIDSAMEATGLTLPELASRIAYKERTLKGVRWGEIPMSAKLQGWLQKVISDATKMELPRTTEDSPVFHRQVSMTQHHVDPHRHRSTNPQDTYVICIEILGKLLKNDPRGLSLARKMLESIEATQTDSPL